MRKDGPSFWSGGGHVLVADDEQEIRLLLRKILQKAGHQVTEAGDGETALRKVRELPPDVVLLDVMMPRMDGIEVCGRLKADPVTAALPVLIVTSLSAREDRLRGIEAGADDFLNKPVDKEEILLRVRNTIRTKHLFDQVQEDYRRLRALEEIKGDLFRMIVRDIREPLSLVRFELEIQKRLVVEQGHGTDMKHLDTACDDISMLVEMANSVLDMSLLDEAKPRLEGGMCDLAALAEEVVESSRPAAGRRITGVVVDGQTTSAWCNRRVIRHALARLVSGAIRSTPDDIEISVTVKEGDDCIRVAVTEKWPGPIREPRRPGPVSNGTQALGDRIGQAFCRLLVRLHGGRTGFESTADNISSWWFELPQDGRATESLEESYL